MITKHIVICVDQTPSMGRKLTKDADVMDAVNNALRNFIGVFRDKPEDAKKAEEAQEQFLLTVVTFDKECRHSDQPVDLTGYNPDFSAAKEGKACLAGALDMAVKQIRGEETGYIVLITDGMPEPGENEDALNEAIGNAEKCARCCTAGFSAASGETSLRTLLDHFTNQQIKSFQNPQEWRGALEAAAKKIVGDAGDAVNGPGPGPGF